MVRISDALTLDCWKPIWDFSSPDVSKLFRCGRQSLWVAVQEGSQSPRLGIPGNRRCRWPVSVCRWSHLIAPCLTGFVKHPLLCFRWETNIVVTLITLVSARWKGQARVISAASSKTSSTSPFLEYNALLFPSTKSCTVILYGYKPSTRLLLKNWEADKKKGRKINKRGNSKSWEIPVNIWMHGPPLRAFQKIH